MTRQTKDKSYDRKAAWLHHDRMKEKDHRRINIQQELDARTPAFLQYARLKEREQKIRGVHSFQGNGQTTTVNYY
jgi:hypothetical protein